MKKIFLMLVAALMVGTATVNAQNLGWSVDTPWWFCR